jgi:hypothetical protein
MGREVSFERGVEQKSQRHARSTPAEKAFSRAEDRTTTRTELSSEIRSKAVPYSRQNLFRPGQSPSLDQSIAPITTHCSLNAFTGVLNEEQGGGHSALAIRGSVTREGEMKFMDLLS